MIYYRLHIASDQERPCLNLLSQSGELAMPPLNSTNSNTSLVQIYTGPSILIGLFFTWLFWASDKAHHPVQADSLLSPMAGLFSLIVAIWALMVVVRNASIIFGYIPMRYFADYQAEHLTNDLIERPARAFNNLMQVPIFFYVICILMSIYAKIDDFQVTLAWAFVVLRIVHCAIYIALNWVPYRFTFWALSCITLGILWYRFFDQMAI